MRRPFRARYTRSIHAELYCDDNGEGIWLSYFDHAIDVVDGDPVRPTDSGGHVASGDMTFGHYRVEWDRDGKLVSEQIEIREPPSHIGSFHRLVLEERARAMTADCGCAG